VRELRYTIDQPGFRAHEIVLVTTMLDHVLYTKEDLADLYLRRWSVELDLRSIKGVQGYYRAIRPRPGFFSGSHFLRVVRPPRTEYCSRPGFLPPRTGFFPRTECHSRPGFFPRVDPGGSGWLHDRS
jgi:hypothetical protein